MKRAHEELSKSSFDSLLTSKRLHGRITWTEVPQAQEPPDWYLQINNSKFAIEATSIVQVLEQFDPPLEAPKVSISLQNFVDEVEKVALEEDILSGTYFVVLAPVQNLREHREELKNRFLDYIRRTQLISNPEPGDLGFIGNTRVSISKVNQDNQIVLLGISFGSMSEGSATEMLIRLMSSCLEEKAHRLSNLSYPVILLILDAFHYSHIVSWIDCISRLSVPDSIDAIFRTYPNNKAEMLYSRELRFLEVDA